MFIKRLLLGLVAIGFVACNTSANAPITPGPLHAFVPAAVKPFVTSQNAQVLYVANAGSNSIAEFSLGQTAPLRAVTSGIANPGAVVTDSAGTLYVANLSGPQTQVSEYASGKTSPSRTISGLNLCCASGNQPQELSIDSHGSLFVANGGGCPPNNTVTIYAPGQTTATTTITLPSSDCKPFVVAFDTLGTLYVITQSYSGHHGSIYEFGAGQTSPMRVISDANTPIGIAFDSAGNTYVVNYGSFSNGAGGSVAIYPPGMTTPNRTISGLKSALAAVVDGSGTLYVADAADSTVEVYAPGKSVPLRSLPSCYPVALALDGAGDLYVADNGCNSVGVYAPGSDAPSLTISSGINKPTALAVGTGSVPSTSCTESGAATGRTVACAFSPNAVTISTSEGAPYGDVDFWALTKSIPAETLGTFGPTKVLRSYICLSAIVSINDCSVPYVPTGPLSNRTLNGIASRLASFSGTGVRTIIRFTYNFGPTGAKDAPIGTILTQLAQLAPILRANKDVIFGLEAGFIGTWGEWHNSTTNDDTVKAQDALLKAEFSDFHGLFPIFIRWPGVTSDYFHGKTNPQAGMHDDCYAGPSVCSTYSGGPQNRSYANPRGLSSAQLKAYAQAQSTVASLVGEPLGDSVSPLENCKNFIDYAYTYHLQSFTLFPPAAIQQLWSKQGCLSTIYNRIGTRIVLLHSSVSGAFEAGQTIRVSLTIRNDGFGRVVRQRPVYALILSGGAPIVHTLVNSIDLRILQSAKSAQSATFTFNLTLPTSMPSGPLTAALYIADPAMPTDPAYALPLNSVDASGNGIYDSITGYDTFATLNP